MNRSHNEIFHDYTKLLLETIDVGGNFIEALLHGGKKLADVKKLFIDQMSMHPISKLQSENIFNVCLGRAKMENTVLSKRAMDNLLKREPANYYLAIVKGHSEFFGEEIEHRLVVVAIDEEGCRRKLDEYFNMLNNKNVVYDEVSQMSYSEYIMVGKYLKMIK